MGEQLVGPSPALDRLTERRDELRLPLQPQQVVAQMIAERPGIIRRPRESSSTPDDGVLLATM